jgi:hypothetical protein
MRWLAALLLAGCAVQTPDVCGGVSGSCVAVEIKGQSPSFDEVHLAVPEFPLDASSRESPPAPLSLPVILAVEAPIAFSGPFHLSVELRSSGTPVAVADTNDQLQAGEHKLITLIVTPIPSGSDLAVADLAVVDLAPDLAVCGTVGQACCPPAGMCLAGGCCDGSKCIGDTMPCSNGRTCTLGSCGCGLGMDWPCCAGSSCPGGGMCVGCATGSLCETGPADCCGGPGQRCCTKAGALCGGTLSCIGGFCGASSDMGVDMGSGCGNCPVGCCANGACQPVSSPFGCGNGGVLCQQCAPTLACMADGSCRSTACMNGAVGCCAGGVCPELTVCAADGTCHACGQTNTKCCAGGYCAQGCCVGGNCLAVGVSCGSTGTGSTGTCRANGLCDGNPGSSGEACAGAVPKCNTGTACFNGKCTECGGIGQICCDLTNSAIACTTAGSCCDSTTNLCVLAGATCANNATCQNGSCGTCTSSSSCPANQACSSSTHTCSTNCNAASLCNGGCCSAGVCVTGGTNAACGLNGNVCSNCSLTGNTCLASGSCSGAAPTVSGFSPTSGPVGTTVTINGTGFDATSIVKVSGISWVINNITGTTTISANVPGGAASGTICVSTSNGTGCSPGSFTVTGPLTFVTSSLPDAFVGQAYSQTLAASGGTSPYMWTLVGGALPTGFALDAPSGVLSGTTSAASGSIFNFMVKLNDSLAASTTKALSITVDVPACSASTCSGSNCCGAGGCKPLSPTTCGLNGASCLDCTQTVLHAAGPFCTGAGSCNHGTCAAGFGDCDGNSANGCEDDVTKDAANCGSCGNNCATSSAGHLCINGACGCNLPADCTGGVSCSATTHLCLAVSSVAITPANPTIPGGSQQFHATATYSDSTTGDVTGAASWSSANPAAATMSSTPGLALAAGVGTSTISAMFGGQGGTTVLTVNCGPGACSGCCNGNSCVSPTNGAFCGTGGSACFSCGTSGDVCPGGSCSCGGGPACNSPATCMSGSCACPNGQKMCGGLCIFNNQCCTAADCGAVVNASGVSCAGGICNYSNCLSGFGDCDGNRANGCETPTDSVNHCAGCAACDNVRSLGASCNGATCLYSGCNSGTIDCNSAAPNTDGCECPTAPTAAQGTVSCCGGTGCQTEHSNGQGAHFYDCAASATYDQTEATNACKAFTGDATGGACSMLACAGGDAAICGTLAGSCACWGYSGSIAGKVHNSGSTTCSCPTAGDGAWN